MSWKKAARAELERRRAVIRARLAATTDADATRIRLFSEIRKAEVHLDQVRESSGNYRTPAMRGLDAERAQALSDGVRAQFQHALEQAEAGVADAREALERHEANLAAALPPIPDGPDLGELERAARALELIDNPQMFVEIR